MLSTHHLCSTNGIHFQDNVHLPDEYIIPGLIDIAQSDNAYCCLLLSSYLVVWLRWRWELGGSQATRSVVGCGGLRNRDD